MTIGDDINSYSKTNISTRKLSEKVHEETYLKMLEDLSKNSRIIFVSQNIDDPDLNETEKSKIADEIYQESQFKFINRFGKFLTMEHLKFFENTENEEILFMIKELEINLRNHHKNIRNRRYYALKNTLTKNDYFSETEMMKRDPLLYEELIGQYLNASEKKLRDGFDMKNTILSEILLDQMDKDRFKLELKQLQKNDKNNDSDDNDSSERSAESSNNNTCQMESEQSCTMNEQSFHKKWGEFEDSASNDIEIKPSTSKCANVTSKQKPKLITTNEKEILRQEFVSIMHNRFLNGDDKNFDYTEIDENSINDDLKTQQQDLEDKYFDESSNDEEIIQNECIDDNEEDDLDIFMKHLNENPSLKNEEN